MSKHTNKALIWDLGNTLLQADTWCFASQLGLTDFILYPLLEWKNPKKIHEIAMDLLTCMDSPIHEAQNSATAQGKLMPPVMCHWLSGTIDMNDIQKNVDVCLKSWVAQGKFSSKRQQRLATNVLKLVFDTEKFVQCMKPIPAGISLLQECSKKQASGILDQYILSNWDPHSFEFLLRAPNLSTILTHFAKDAITISGHLGVIKPQLEIYEEFLQRHNLMPGQCFLIDDQEENIKGAEQLGITGIHLNKGNYSAVREKLLQFGIL